MLLIDRADGLVLVQDLGRPHGWRMGVGRSGAFDVGAHAGGQRLVGNPLDAAGLELTLAELAFTTTASTVVAVTGAATDVRLDGLAAPFGVPIAVPAHATVHVLRPRHGCRVYVSVAGGIDGPSELGSRSTDILAMIGPASVGIGDEFHLGAPVGRPSWRGVAAPTADAGRAIDAAPGPHVDLLTTSAVSAVVGADSNRGGVRLTCGLTAVVPDLPSFPVVPGAVQLTPSGELIVLGPDAGVTGGYPVVALVGEDGLDQLAQCRPGDPVTLRVSRSRSAR
jgi:biotin-dependent carboxylase-like uncharacterized protein